MAVSILVSALLCKIHLLSHACITQVDSNIHLFTGIRQLFQFSEPHTGIRILFIYYHMPVSTTQSNGASIIHLFTGIRQLFQFSEPLSLLLHSIQVMEKWEGICPIPQALLEV